MDGWETGDHPHRDQKTKNHLRLFVGDSDTPPGLLYMFTATNTDAGVGVLLYGTSFCPWPIDTLRRGGYRAHKHCKLHELEGNKDFEAKVQYWRIFRFLEHPGLVWRVNNPKVDWDRAQARMIDGQETAFGPYWLEASGGAEAWVTKKLEDCVFLSIGKLVPRCKGGHLYKEASKKKSKWKKNDRQQCPLWSEAKTIIKNKLKTKGMEGPRLKVVLRELKALLFTDDGELGTGLSEAAVIVEIKKPAGGAKGGDGASSPFDRFVKKAIHVMRRLKTPLDVDRDSVKIQGAGLNSRLVRMVNESRSETEKGNPYNAEEKARAEKRKKRKREAKAGANDEET